MCISAKIKQLKIVGVNDTEAVWAFWAGNYGSGSDLPPLTNWMPVKLRGWAGNLGPGTWGPGNVGPGNFWATGTLGMGTLGTGTCELDTPGNFWSGRKDAEFPRLSIIFQGFARVWKGMLAHGPPTGTLGARLWLWADEPGGFAGNFWAVGFSHRGCNPQSQKPPVGVSSRKSTTSIGNTSFRDNRGPPFSPHSPSAPGKFPIKVIVATWFWFLSAVVARVCDKL